MRSISQEDSRVNCDGAEITPRSPRPKTTVGFSIGIPCSIYHYWLCMLQLILLYTLYGIVYQYEHMLLQ